MRVAASRSQTRMPNLTLCEVRRNMGLLHVTYPTVAKRVHTTSRDFQAVADRIKGIPKHVMVVEWGCISGLKHPARRAALEICLKHPNCGRINPHFAVAFPTFRRDFLSAPH